MNKMEITPSKRIALVITYNPADNFAQHLENLFTEFDEIIIVDNRSMPETQAMLQAEEARFGGALKLLLNPKNLGIATALNQGIALAIAEGRKFIVVLDQDSIPVPGMANALWNGFLNHPNRAQLAILAPDIQEDALRKPYKYLRAKNKFVFLQEPCAGQYIRNVTYVITSGSFLNLDVFKKLGPFREDFFIDYVDIEYCLRALQRGYEVSVLRDARLKHNLGKRQQKYFLGRSFTPTFHAPFRWYYIIRNRIATLRLYALRFPHFFFHEIQVTTTSILRVLLLENRRVEKLKAILLGSMDGVLGRMGESSPRVKKILKYS